MRKREKMNRMQTNVTFRQNVSLTNGVILLETTI